MMQTNMHEAKTKLSQLVESALSGEEVVIAKAGKPLVKLVPYQTPQKRQFGLLKGQIEISEDFDSPETQQEIANDFGL